MLAQVVIGPYSQKPDATAHSEWDQLEQDDDERRQSCAPRWPQGGSAVDHEIRSRPARRRERNRRARRASGKAGADPGQRQQGRKADRGCGTAPRRQTGQGPDRGPAQPAGDELGRERYQ
jgi:hypothetical protein